MTNRDDQDWVLDGGEQQLELASEAVSATTQRVTKPLSLTVPARSTRALDLFFPLPGTVAERDLRAFGVRWTVHLGVGARVIVGRTPFERASAQAAHPVPAISTADSTLEGELPLPGSEPPNRRGPMP